MIDITSAIAEGQTKAQDTTKNLQEVTQVFTEFNQQLKSQDIAIEYGKNLLSSIVDSLENIEKLPKIERGTLYIKLLSGNNSQKAIGKWSQHPDGYPFTLEYLMERTDCWDKEALILRLKSIVSSGQFWLKVKELKESKT